MKQQLQDHPVEKEAAPDEAVADTSSKNLPDDESLKASVPDEVGSSNNKESPGRASGSASSNTDLSDFVHIEMRSDEDGQVKVGTVDSLNETKKKKKQKDDSATAREAVREAVRDMADSPTREGKPAVLGQLLYQVVY